jgi:hypothetical protein
MADVKVPTRQDRLKLALRENLKRRKFQARGRKDEAGGTDPDLPDPSRDEGQKT